MGTHYAELVGKAHQIPQGDGLDSVDGGGAPMSAELIATIEIYESPITKTRPSRFGAAVRAGMSRC